MTQQRGWHDSLSAMSALSTAKAPRPSASAKQNASCASSPPRSRSIRGQQQKVSTDVRKMICRYSTLRIQKTGTRPRSTSRVVPPPTHVNRAMTAAPSTSISLRAAWIVPEKAKTAVPKKSRKMRASKVL